MPGNPLVRFDEGRVGRTARCRLLSYSTVSIAPRCPFRRTTPGWPRAAPHGGLDGACVRFHGEDDDAQVGEFIHGGAYLIRPVR
jgi:hypothetical protein